MIVSGVTLIGLLVLAAIMIVGLAPASPQVTLGFAGLLVGVGAVMALADGSESTMSVFGIVFAVTGLVIGAVAVRRDATSTHAADHDRAPRP